MSFRFRSIRSSSGGNCLLLRAEDTTILFDCGLSSMKRTRQVLEEHFDQDRQPDAVLLTHAHTDHISYYPLKVLEQQGCKVMMHADCIEQLQSKHFKGYGFNDLQMTTFGDESFNIGSIEITPIRLSHHPLLPTFGFAIVCNGKKAVIATDFNDGRDIIEHLVDADFIFVESNHDPELLRKYYNPNSQFHMSNPQTAELLCQARKKSGFPPKAVMLGHISDQRNTSAIAIKETKRAFKKHGLKVDFNLSAAPLKHPGPEIEIGL
ncbi:MAG: MBL fold metallo-hydrolase [Planctomycetes bacterium]|nr:MBL fold metallo-hydrolase [Planctomycetota bacterium]